MKVAIIGAGFTGLAAAYKLVDHGHEITVFEKDSNPGGLALGFKKPHWDWPLEKHYHHWFTNDLDVLKLAKEIGHEVIVKRPKTSVYVEGKIYQFDSPISVLTFPKLSLRQRLRMAGVLGFLRFNPFWKPLEGILATEFLPLMMGEKPYKKIWDPLLRAKFGEHAKNISLAWFWARVKKRTASLAYPKGGFLSFAQALVKKIEENGGRLLFNSEVKEIMSNDKVVQVKFNRIGNWKLEIGNYDKVIVTMPSSLFLKIAFDLPQEYQQKLSNLKGLGAINLILRLKKPFLTDETYWLNICNKTFPFLSIVEHTNFMDKKYYDNEHIIYIGNYLPHDHPYFKMEANELLKVYDPFIRKINSIYRLSLIAYHLFKVPFAQPIIPVNYSRIIPPFNTPLKNVYLANIQQVYPWDRGTNYAVELGEKAAKLII